jgi:sodium-dependent dicarboxylate transporter 2/3/5
MGICVGTINKFQRQYIPLGWGVFILLLTFTLPEIGPFTREMVRVIGLVAFGMIFWVLRPVPIAATSLFVIVLMPLLQVAPSLGSAFSGFTSPANYFVIASFAFGFALQKTSFSNRLILSMLKISQGKTSKLVLTFMMATYIISMFISDIAAVVIFVGFVVEFIQLIEEEYDKKRLGKILLLAVPFGSVLGGTATMVGSSVNVLALHLMKSHAGVDVTFLQWSCLALPISIIVLVVCWRVLLLFQKTPDITPELVEKYIERLDEQIRSGSSSKEPAILAVLGALIVGWVVSSWIPWLDTTTIAIVGMLILFAPGIEAFAWAEFKNNMSWEIPLMGGATVQLGNIAIKCGLVDLLINGTTAAFPNLGIFGFVALIGVLMTLLLLIIPVGPAMTSMMTIPVYIMAEKLSINPIMAVVVVGIFASNSTILPLNAVYLVSYSKGYWRSSDMTIIGIFTSLVWIGLAMLWIPFISRLVF